MYHLKNHDMISLYKHMLYPVMFVSPLMGIYLSNLVGRNEKKHRSFLIFLSLLIVGVSSKQLYDMEHAYPNTKVAVDKLNSVIVLENSLLSEDSYLFRYNFIKN